MGCQLSVVGSRFSVCLVFVVWSYRLWVAGFWLLVVRSRFLVIGCGLMVVGCAYLKFPGLPFQISLKYIADSIPGRQ